MSARKVDFVVTIADAFEKTGDALVDSVGRLAEVSGVCERGTVEYLRLKRVRRRYRIIGSGTHDDPRRMVRL